MQRSAPSTVWESRDGWFDDVAEWSLPPRRLMRCHRKATNADARFRDADQRAGFDRVREPSEDYLDSPVHPFGPHSLESERDHAGYDILTQRHDATEVEIVRKDDPLLADCLVDDIVVRQPLEALITQMNGIVA